MLLVLSSLVLGSVLAFFLYWKFGGVNSKDQSLLDLKREVNNLETELRLLEEEIKCFIPAEEGYAFFELITELQNSLNLEQSKINISSLELTVLEKRLREFSDLDQEFESSELETQELIKGFTTSLAELSSKLSQLEFQLPVVNEALNELREVSDFEIFFSGMQSTLGEAILDFKSLTELFSQSFDLVRYLKVRFDALDVEFAELYERFGELDS